MCLTNSNETLCGKPVDSYRDGMKVYFCRATKGRIVWALATARLSLGDLRQLLRPGTTWFGAGQGEMSDLKEMLTFFGALRRLCLLSHDGLDVFVPAWAKMVIRLAETMDKCVRYRGARDGMFPPGDGILAEWERQPEPAYAWLKFVNRERKQAKKAAKDAGEYDAGNHEGSYRRMGRPQSIVQQQQQQQQEARENQQQQRAVSVVPTIATDVSSRLTPEQRQRVKRIVDLAKDEVRVKDMDDRRARIEERRLISAISATIGRWMDKMEAKTLWREAVKALEEARISNSGGLERLQARADETHAAYQAFKAGERER